MGSVSRRTDLGFDSPHLCFFHERIVDMSLQKGIRNARDMLIEQVAELNQRNDLMLKEIWRLRRERKKLLDGIQDVKTAIKEEQRTTDKYISSLKTRLHARS